MPFHITFEPLNRIPGVKPKTVMKETAAEAWASAQGLRASDEHVTVRNDAGRVIEDWELQELAAKEQH